MAKAKNIEYYRRQAGVDCLESANITKAHDNDLCIELLNVARKQNMVPFQVRRFKDNVRLAKFFSTEEVQGILNRTICEVLNKFREYQINLNKTSKKTGAKKVSRRSNNTKTDFSTFGLLKGYFVNSFINNIKKEYNRQSTQKRSHATAFISLNPSPLSEDSKTHSKSGNILEAMISDSSSINTREREDILQELILFFKEEDRKANLEVTDLKKQSKLARLFVAMINPRSKGDQKNIINKIGVTDHYFKEGRKKIIEKIQKHHADIGREWLNIVVERDCDETQDPKKNKNVFEKPDKYELVKFNRLQVLDDPKSKKVKDPRKVPRINVHTLTLAIKKTAGDGSVTMVEEKVITHADKLRELSYDQGKQLLESKASKTYDNMLTNMRKLRGY